MATAEEQITLGERVVTIRYKPGLRNITLRLNSKGDIIVSAPRHAPLSRIEALLRQSEGWLAKQLAKFSGKRRMPEEGAFLFGKWLPTEIRNDAERRVGCYIEEDSLIINTIEPAGAKKLFDRFIKTTAGSYLPSRLAHWAEQMGITYKSLTLREQVSRWGSCSSTGSINLNWRLVHAPLDVIDYVLIHELAHRVHMDHSQRFWNLVERYDPEHKKHRGWLKRDGFWLVEK